MNTFWTPQRDEVFKAPFYQYLRLRKTVRFRSAAVVEEKRNVEDTAFLFFDLQEIAFLQIKKYSAKSLKRKWQSAIVDIEAGIRWVCSKWLMGAYMGSLSVIPFIGILGILFIVFNIFLFVLVVLTIIFGVIRFKKKKFKKDISCIISANCFSRNKGLSNSKWICELWWD